MNGIHLARRATLTVLTGALFVCAGSTAAADAPAGADGTTDIDQNQKGDVYAQAPPPAPEDDVPEDETGQPEDEQPGQETDQPGQEDETGEGPRGVLGEREGMGPDGKFSARLTPGVWAPWVMGDITTDGEESDIDRSMSETLGDPTPGYTLDLDIGFGDFGLLADAMWLDLSEDDVETDTDFDEADADHSKFVVDGSVAWITDLDGFGEIGPHVGARYTMIDSQLDTVAQDGTEETFEASEGWIDPIVGVTGRIDPPGMFYVPYYADIGGIIAGSDFSWKGEVALGVELHDYVGVELGYRHLRIDYQGDDLDYNTMTTGPTLGITGKFE